LELLLSKEDEISKKQKKQEKIKKNLTLEKAIFKTVITESKNENKKHTILTCKKCVVQKVNFTG
jgi:hypothetical protein